MLQQLAGRGRDPLEAANSPTVHLAAWADWLGVPRHTFSAVFGAVIASGRDYREVFQHFRPGFDLEKERQARIDAGLGEYVNANDLYPDVRPCLTELRERGYFVGIAGNQTVRAGRFIRELNLPADLIATSDDWGVSKPSVKFFRKLVEVSGHPAKSCTLATAWTTTSIQPPAQACPPPCSGAVLGDDSQYPLAYFDLAFCDTETRRQFSVRTIDCCRIVAISVMDKD